MDDTEHLFFEKMNKTDNFTGQTKNKEERHKSLVSEMKDRPSFLAPQALKA